MNVFAGLNANIIERLAVRKVYYGPGAGGSPNRKYGRPIYLQDEPGRCLYLIREGCVRLSQLTEDGDETVLWVLKEGELFGALGESQYTCSAIPGCDVSVSQWDRDELIVRVPGIIERLGQVCSQRLQELERRFVELASWSVPRRLASAVVNLAGDNDEMPMYREVLAQHTGTTLFTVSRLLSTWKRNGLVDIWRGGVRVLDCPGLEAIRDGK